MREKKSIPSRGIALIALVLVAGCSTWQPVSSGPPGVIAAERPPAVRLTLTNGAVATVRAPLVRNDSIVSGDLGGVGVAASDVGLIEIRRFSLGRTLTMVGLGVLAGAGWAAVASANSGGSGDGGGDPLPKGIGPAASGGLVWTGRLFP